MKVSKKAFLAALFATVALNVTAIAAEQKEGSNAFSKFFKQALPTVAKTLEETNVGKDTVKIAGSAGIDLWKMGAGVVKSVTDAATSTPEPAKKAPAPLTDEVNTQPWKDPDSVIPVIRATQKKVRYPQLKPVKATVAPI